jgi:hypothetical protein
MKKFLFLSIAIVAVMAVSTLFAADDYLITTGALIDSTWCKKGDNPYTLLVVDTATFHAEDGDSTIDLGALYYNFQMRSLNAAGDSGHVKVAFSAQKGIWHDDSVARNLDWATIGDNSGDDYFYAPIGSRYIYVRPVVDGTADSTCILEVKCFR